MPRKRPEYLPGQIYHFYNRGAHRISIFKEPTNYLFVIGKIKKYSAKFDLSVLAYCLMPNHYHFLVRQDGEQSAGLLPRYVFNSYSKAYNKRFLHSGTLFEGNYMVKTVLKDSHLLHLCRYIHGNPVKDGLVADPADWPYSNYLEWIGQRSGSLYDPEFIQANFPVAAHYRAFVLDDLLGRDLPDEVKKYLSGLES
jgi:putative transposase